MIKINLIPILIAINNEYGTNELIRRLKNILNIDMTELLNQSLDFKATKNSIIITNTTTGVKHTIEFDTECYTYRKDFEKYFTIKYYDFSKIEVRRLAAFQTSDDELLVVDEINEEDIVNRRITKTTNDDKDFIKGSFEKEELFYRKHNIRERYKYTEDLLCNKKVSKQIEMPNNLYTYSFRSTTNAASNVYQYGYIESSTSIDKPQILVAGRIRDNNELLISSIKTPVPNILIRGRNVISTKEIAIELYNICFYKMGDTIQIILSSTILPSYIQSKEEFHLSSETLGKITPEDIDLMLEFISNHQNFNIAHEVKQELQDIKQQILIKNKEKIRDFDFFDSRFLIFNQFEYLVFDIYENLPYYEQMINKSITPDKEENPPTLKKI